VTIKVAVVLGVLCWNANIRSLGAGLATVEAIGVVAHPTKIADAASSISILCMISPCLTLNSLAARAAMQKNHAIY
jgi:hypothetical protein